MLPPPSHLFHFLLGRTCSALLFSDILEVKRQKGTKKNMTFLLFEKKVASQ
jgi:hypothetical protein